MSSYSITATGKTLAEVMDSVRAQAGTQGATMSGPDKEMLDDAVAHLEKKLPDHIREGDSVAVSINGHLSQSPQSFASQSSIGISISRATEPVKPIVNPNPGEPPIGTGAEGFNAAGVPAASTSAAPLGSQPAPTTPASARAVTGG